MRSPVRLISMLLLLESAIYSAITPVLPHYEHVLRASKPAIGVLAAAYTAGLIPGAFIGGSVATRAGVRRATVAGLILLALGTAGFGLAHNLVELDALRAAQGVACGLIWVGALTWVIAVTARERRGALLGSVIGAALFGTLIGPLLGIAAVAIGFGITFALVAVVIVALAARLLRYAEPPDPASDQRTPLRRILANRGLMTGAWLVALDALTIGATNVLIPLRLARLGAGTVAVGAVFLIAAATRTAISPALGRATDRHGVERPMAVGLVLSALLMVVLPLPASAVALAVLSVVALGGPLTTWMIPAGTLMTHSAERGGIGLITSSMLFNLAYALGETFGAPAAAGLSQATTDAVPFFLLAAMMLVTLAPVLRDRRRPDPTPASPERETVAVP